MRNLVTISLLLYLFPAMVSGQQKFCSDSSIRIKYSSADPNYPFGLFGSPDTSGINTFIGGYYNVPMSENGIMLLKTNWGDSIYWARRFRSDPGISIDAHNILKSPDGSFIIAGTRRNLNSRSFLICKTDLNGNVAWAKHFPHISNGINYPGTGTNTNNNIYITNSGIYFAIYLSPYDVVAKLDLNGNLIWSRAFVSLPFNSHVISNGLFVNNGIVYFSSRKVRYDPITLSMIFDGPVISLLNETSGNLIGSSLLSIIPDSYAKGLEALNISSLSDGTFSLTGWVCTFLPNGSINQGQPNTRFNLHLDANLNFLRGYYYDTQIPYEQIYQFDINTQKQTAFLYNNGSNSDRYFITYDSLQNFLRCRKFSVPSSSSTGNSDINFDDKQNVHFIYNYSLNGQQLSEYARLSDLAPANALQCFGIDTASVFVKYPLSVLKESFLWDYTYTNVLNSPSVNIYTSNGLVNKEVVCKQVSYCDSIKIKGPSTVCYLGGNVRFSSYLNGQCLKSIRWQTDTAFSTIIGYESDSAVTLEVKRTGQFYLKAFVNNCVIADSILITVASPQFSVQLNKQDSILCPGGSILLKPNPLLKTFLWQDGSTQSTYLVSAPGLYKVVASDSCGNVLQDSILIKLLDTSFHLLSSYIICPYDSADVFLPSDVYNISWQPSVYGILYGNKLVFFPPQTTSYIIQAKRSPGCNLQKEIIVEPKSCPEWVRFPSAFTPNKDGLNEYFKPGVSGSLQYFDLRIFDRSGQLLFRSNNPYNGWDGAFEGKNQNNGVYVYLCKYKFHNAQEQLLKGTIMLIR